MSNFQIQQIFVDFNIHISLLLLIVSFAFKFIRHENGSRFCLYLSLLHVFHASSIFLPFVKTVFLGLSHEIYPDSLSLRQMSLTSLFCICYIPFTTLKKELPKVVLTSLNLSLGVIILIGLFTFIPKRGKFKSFNLMTSTNAVVKTPVITPFFYLSTSITNTHNYAEYLLTENSLSRQGFNPIFTNLEPSSILNSLQKDRLKDFESTLSGNSVKHAILSAYNELGRPIDYKSSVQVKYIEDDVKKTEVSVGDIITKINEQSVKSKSQIINYLSNYNLNSVFLTIKRNKKTLVVKQDLEKSFEVMFQLQFDMVDQIVFKVPKNIKVLDRGGLGDSWGLGLALHIYYSNVNTKLNSAVKIAVTGAIDETGKVDKVGGLYHKIRSSLKEKSTHLILPTSLKDESLALINKIDKVKYPHPTKILFVDNLKDAIKQLNPILLIK